MGITIETPSRIHLGIIDLNGNLGRIYGSIGVALERPKTSITVEKSDRLEIIGNGNRIEQLLHKISNHFRFKPRVRIELRESIPEHVGLGSGTQLSLAIGVAISRIYGIDVGIDELSVILGRGRLSGIGIEAFKNGGFIIDAGHEKDNIKGIPPVILRHDFPEDWSFLIIIPEIERGLSGREEDIAFKRIIPSDPEIPARICRIIQMKLLPSLMLRDIDNFGEALMEIDMNVGLYFKHIQGGIYKNEFLSELIEFSLSNGAKGAGQSSWGPGIYLLIENKNANKLKKKLINFLNNKEISADVIKTNANNSGARIMVD